MITKLKKDRLYCFSPEIMFITFVLEFFLAVYTYLMRKPSLFKNISILILLMLGIFQFAEYQICRGNDSLFWTRIGFVAVTTLPPLGLHLISIITKKKNYLKPAYILMIFFIFIFSLLPRSVANPFCGGNYIIFQSPESLFWIYGIYYFGFLGIGIWEAFEYLIKKKNPTLFWTIIGYASFLIPMGIVYIISPSARSAVPSIMCGFTIILAIILTIKVLPEYEKTKKR